MKQPGKKQPQQGQTAGLVQKEKSYDGNSLILLLYAIIPVITPNFYTFDSNGPKFLAISLLNLGVFIFFITNKRSPLFAGKFRRFFSQPTGILYSLFLLVALASFLKAWNLLESVLMFAQLFTIFSAALIIFVIFSLDKKYLEQVAVIMVFVLLFDCIVFFFNIFLFIIGEIRTISEIKSVYSNKNILSSAIFVKLPFALWLSRMGKDKWRKLGTITLSLGFLSVLLLSTRAFLLGLTGLTLVYLGYTLIIYFQKKERSYLQAGARYLIFLAGAVILMLFIQNILYPKTWDASSIKVMERVKAINTVESSAKSRIDTWNFSIEMIEKEPLLGVGLGNWKIAELAYECPFREDFDYILHNHNDFLEVTAETGIPGGVVFLLLILAPCFFFVRSIFKNVSADQQAMLFLSAFGLFCYSFDAFFNFPMTRPEVQVLFAFFIAAGVAGGSLKKKKKPTSERQTGKALMMLMGLLAIPTGYLLYQNFISLRMQRIAHDEVQEGRMVHSSAFMLEGFPDIPTINAGGEPIAVTKSRYLINEEKHAEAIRLLRNDHASPYDGRYELFMMYAFDRMGNKDSTLFYAKKVNEKKPLFYQAIEKVAMIQQEGGDNQTPIATMSKVISRDPGNMAAIEFRARCYFFSQEYRKCIEDLNRVLAEKPENGTLLNIRGICFNALKDNEAACRDFSAAVKFGCNEAADNIARVCNGSGKANH